MNIRRISLLLLLAVFLGGTYYFLATYQRNAAKPKTLETPMAAANVPLSLADSNGVQWLKADTVLKILAPSTIERRNALELIEDKWKPGYLANLVEAFSTTGVRHPQLGGELIRVLEKKTGENFGFDKRKWMAYSWNQDLVLAPDYAEFKTKLYEKIDKRFAEYFDDRPKSEIRLDEVVWGGVVKDGIPPLRKPKMISAVDASYLADSDIVFGIEINGDARAYPNRILAHHEMFTDTIGGLSVCGVY